MVVIPVTTTMSMNSDRQPVNQEPRMWAYSQVLLIKGILWSAHVCTAWDSLRVKTFNLINLRLRLLHMVETYDTQYKHFTTLHMSFVKHILYFDIYTQMALQAPFTRVLFILHKLWIINLLLDLLTYAWLGVCDFCLPCHLVMSESTFCPLMHFSPCQFATFDV